jgi:uncharacterized protein YigE (DUF2233 family)
MTASVSFATFCIRSATGLSLPFILSCAFAQRLVAPASLGAQSASDGATADASRRAGTRTRIDAVSCAPRTTAALPPRLQWHGHAPLRWAEWAVALGARGIRARMIVVDMDPTGIALSLEIARDGSDVVPWSLDDVPPDAPLAFNAGQFTDAGPWGLVVHRGREWQPAGRGPLSGALVVDSGGRVSITGPARLDAVRAAGGVREALQSFPLLLENARAPSLLCSATTPLDRTHRDIRFAIGVRADGHVLLALSRYEGAGALAARLPVGPTTPEMAEIMYRLGARDALMLDGGLSAQLLLRDGSVTHRWDGLRRVPLAIVGRRVPR